MTQSWNKMVSGTPLTLLGERTLESDIQKHMSLRERKKMKTRLSIQQHAMQLFRRQGYNETTVEEIAEAAEVSPSTFFRYFPTKESVVLTDFYDPVAMDLIMSQPAHLSPLEAIRQAMKQGYESMSTEEYASEMERSKLIMSVPELRAAAVQNFFGIFQMMTRMLAKRTGLSSQDTDVRLFTGAFFGIALSVGLIWAEDPTQDMLQILDEAISFMEAGLPLAPDKESE